LNKKLIALRVTSAWQHRAIMKSPEMRDGQPVFRDGRISKTVATHLQIVRMFFDSLRTFKESGMESKLLEKPVFTAYGSSRIGPDQHWYKKAHQISLAIAKELGWSFIGGAGPGIMEATSKGAHDAGVSSFGVKIYMPGEQELNKFVDDDKVIICRELISRKLLLRKFANLPLVFPGGFGTMDEIFEILAKKDRDIKDNAPVIFVGSRCWGSLEEIIKKHRESGKYKKPLEQIMVVLPSDPKIIIDFVRKNMDAYLNVPSKKPIDVLGDNSDLLSNLRAMKRVNSPNMVTVSGGSNINIPPSTTERTSAIVLGEFLTEAGISMITRSNQNIMSYLQLGYLSALRKGAEDIPHVLLYNKEGGLDCSMYQAVSPSNIALSSRKLLHDKMVMCNNSNCGFVFFSGGMSTHDVFFEAAVMMRIGLMKKVPIILFGDDVKWDMELEFLKSHLVKTYGTIDASDLDYIYRTNDINEVKAILANQRIKNDSSV